MTPRTRCTEFHPILPVRDLRRTLEHYAASGFEADNNLIRFGTPMPDE